MPESPGPPFQQLDFLYMPSRDVAADRSYLTDVLGGRAVFAVEAMGTRVAAVELGSGPPLLLAEHLAGEAPILVYRVADLAASLATLAARGWAPTATLEIPQGAVLLVSHPRRPTARPVPAHQTRGRQPLQRPTGLLMPPRLTTPC